MKTFFIFLFILAAGKGYAQADTLLIRNTTFITVKQSVKTEYDKPDTLLKLYRIENGKRRCVLSHYVFQYGADCNNEYTDKGTLAVNADKLLLKTTYFQTGHDPIPLSRVRTYRVSASGKLLRISDITKYKDHVERN